MNRERRLGNLQYCAPVARRNARPSENGRAKGEDVVHDGEAQAVHAESQSLLCSASMCNPGELLRRRHVQIHLLLNGRQDSISIKACFHGYYRRHVRVFSVGFVQGGQLGLIPPQRWHQHARVRNETAYGREVLSSRANMRPSPWSLGANIHKVVGIDDNDNTLKHWEAHWRIRASSSVQIDHFFIIKIGFRGSLVYG